MSEPEHTPTPSDVEPLAGEGLAGVEPEKAVRKFAFGWNPFDWARWLYDWVLHWADTRYGTWALFLMSMAEASFFPIPPDVLLIALCLGERRKWLRFAAACTVASVLGGLACYAVGWGMWAAVDELFFAYVPGFTEKEFETVSALYDQWNFWIVFIASFTPLPYKVMTVTAGAAGINLVMFAIAITVGRSARFFLVGALLYLFGEPIKRFIDRWFNLLTIIFAVLLAGGFLALRYLH